MSSNQDYKNAALNALKGNWAPAVLATLVYILIVGALGGATSIPTGASVAAVLSGCSLLVSVFLIGPIEVGYVNSIRLFYKEGNRDLLSNIFSLGFTNYLHIVGTYVLMSIKIILWTLLLIIPGLVKSFAYALTPIIMVENPELKAREAISLSEKMMSGHKYDLLWLYLSFIGWFLLACLTCGIGFFWLVPYVETSVIAFYDDVKAEYNLKKTE